MDQSTRTLLRSTPSNRNIKFTTLKYIAIAGYGTKYYWTQTLIRYIQKH
jgi:hypothetical protein